MKKLLASLVVGVVLDAIRVYATRKAAEAGWAEYREQWLSVVKAIDEIKQTGLPL